MGQAREYDWLRTCNSLEKMSAGSSPRISKIVLPAAQRRVPRELRRTCPPATRLYQLADGTGGDQAGWGLAQAYCDFCDVWHWNRGCRPHPAGHLREVTPPRCRGRNAPEETPCCPLCVHPRDCAV